MIIYPIKANLVLTDPKNPKVAISGASQFGWHKICRAVPLKLDMSKTLT